MTKEETMKLALEALESKYIVNCGAWRVQQNQAITALREALAEQPEVWVTPKLRPLAKLAKELDGVVADVEQGDGFDDVCLDTVKYVRDELAEQPAQQQEPFGYLWPTGMHPEFRYTQQKRDGVDGMPVYTSPPASKPWVGLSTNDLDEIDAPIREKGHATIAEIYRAIEAKLKEKNNG